MSFDVNLVGSTSGYHSYPRRSSPPILEAATDEGWRPTWLSAPAEDGELRHFRIGTFDTAPRWARTGISAVLSAGMFVLAVSVWQQSRNLAAAEETDYLAHA